MSRRVFTLNEALAEILRENEDDFSNGEGMSMREVTLMRTRTWKKMNQRCRSLLKAQEMPLVIAARRTFNNLLIFIDRLDPTNNPLKHEQNNEAKLKEASLKSVETLEHSISFSWNVVCETLQILSFRPSKHAHFKHKYLDDERRIFKTVFFVVFL